jgi:hypothetical protein
MSGSCVDRIDSSSSGHASLIKVAGSIACIVIPLRYGRNLTRGNLKEKFRFPIQSIRESLSCGE